MAHIDDLLRYDGRRVVVTGCASGIGAQLCNQLTDLGADVVGLDVRRPAAGLSEFVEFDLAEPSSIDQAASVVGDRIDALFNVAGVSSGIGDPLLVVTINFLGTRRFTEALLPKIGAGSSVVCVSSLAAANYRDNLPQAAGLLATGSMEEGVQWCRDHPEALADGGYRLSKEAIIGYTVSSAVPLGAKGIRINCSGPGVTETPILDQLLARYGQDYLETIPKPLGRVSDPDEQAAVLAFLGSRAAGYITGQVIWVDGGNIAARQAADYKRG
ncbi:coniferyl-alcohol dehydrogenase [Mycolicibacterium sp. P1-5]|uniref:coniferyl-alcohol dehydrogenase n=1 Tax=Mycolicibacterium sp. P1-5 TaxID=2024617 RepID=UPI0011EF5818|nr:coniferyl-alcohol dehydrogenase [Mycolicibacterium sp. P1-5]KAA0107518.1 SDR family oxidoreductase [Mycolicibacterium sp. P1-5]